MLAHDHAILVRFYGFKLPIPLIATNANAENRDQLQTSRLENAHAKLPMSWALNSGAKDEPNEGIDPRSGA